MALSKASWRWQPGEGQGLHSGGVGCEENIPGRGNSQCKSPEARTNLAGREWAGNSTEAKGAGRWSRGDLHRKGRGEQGPKPWEGLLFFLRARGAPGLKKGTDKVPFTLKNMYLWLLR